MLARAAAEIPREGAWRYEPKWDGFRAIVFRDGDHVHIASRKDRKMPGENEGDNYVDGFKGLKIIGYQDFVSLECGCKGDRTKAIPAATALLREQWQVANG